MIDIGYENISPTPSYPAGITHADLLGLPWALGGGAKVEKFKTDLKEKLRVIQLGRCCFCRRNLGDTRDPHLEHFLEHSVCQQARFEIQNLALSCSTCNGKKAGYHKTLKSKVVKWRTRFKGAPTHQILPGLCGPFLGVMPPASAYRWVHPHHHSYSLHIGIKKSWIYQPRSLIGKRTIRGVGLNLLSEMERRIRRERMLAKTGLLQLFCRAIAETDQVALKDVFDDLASAIKQKKALSKNSP